jgi:uncharacterized protein (DUF736 family)
MAYDKPYEPKPNTGSLFATKEKSKPTSPDYQGDILIDVSKLEVVNGVAKVKIAGWKKTSASGLVYLSLSVDTFKPANKPAAKPAASVAAMDDDIPF